MGRGTRGWDRKGADAAPVLRLRASKLFPLRLSLYTDRPTHVDSCCCWCEHLDARRCSSLLSDSLFKSSISQRKACSSLSSLLSLSLSLLRFNQRFFFLTRAPLCRVSPCFSLHSLPLFPTEAVVIDFFASSSLDSTEIVTSLPLVSLSASLSLPPSSSLLTRGSHHDV